jgi:hypothetical protein
MIKIRIDHYIHNVSDEKFDELTSKVDQILERMGDMDRLKELVDRSAANTDALKEAVDKNKGTIS